jgi:hypothetical protein
MVFEKKVAAPPERAYMMKAAAVKSTSNRAQTIRIVKDALQTQE